MQSGHLCIINIEINHIKTNQIIESLIFYQIFQQFFTQKVKTF